MAGNLTTSRWLGRAFIRALRAWVNPETPRDAAAISYFSLITLFPALLVLISVVDTFLAPDIHKRVVSLIARLFPGARTFLRANFEDITNPSPALILSCVIVVLWASTWIFTFLENTLNRAWAVPRRRTFWESRIRGIGLLVMGGVLMIISSGFTILVSAARSRTTEMASAYAKDQLLDWLQSSILLLAGFLLVILVFTVTFKLMPDVKVSWKEALPGAIVSSLSWEVAVYVFAKLVPHFDYQRVYGQIGVIIALLVWVYTSCLIMLLGANFSAQLRRIDDLPKGESDSSPKPGQEKVRRFARPRPMP